jgi:23S rRNA pseudouridine1911/1915/1917 synthase
MQEWTVDSADVGMRLDQWLAARTEAGSRSRASEWLARGKVYVNGVPVDAAGGWRRVEAGLRVGVWMDRPGSSRPADRSVHDIRYKLQVIYEDAAIVVLDKPVGMLVEPLPDRAGEESTLVDLLADYYRHEPRSRSYVVHRIDRDTSGLVLFARSTAAKEALKSQFEQRTPERVYQAVVIGQPSPTEGVWRDTLAWDPASLRQRAAHGRDARGKDAEARVRVLEQFADAALIEVTLVTGKRNQIRVQAGMRGHPLLGERQYRFGVPLEPPSVPRIDRQALHAWRLGFVHPTTGRRVVYDAPPPDDFEALLTALRRRKA